jgi:hypothetical protein
MTIAIGQKEAITCWILVCIWFVVEFGVLVNNNCVEEVR